MITDHSHTIIMPYHQSWSDLYATEKVALQKVFGETALDIQHIGSTSIPGLASKPIIDIAVMIDHHEHAEQWAAPLVAIGYEQKLPPSTERHFFTKGTPIQFHLSIAYTNRGGFWQRQIFFRDYLRTHSDVRDAYGALKIDLIKKYPNGGDDYIQAKTAFIQSVLNHANT